MAMTSPAEFLAGARVYPAVFALRPDYRALLIAVAGVRGGPTDDASDAALRRAEQSVRLRLRGAAPESLPQILAWREAFAAFGVKPRQARSSVEALLRRVEAGLPRIDRLTDRYNAISMEHVIPIGGEDLDRYAGPPHLLAATGDEPFDTVADGEAVLATPEPGEIVWRDDLGITCRRWNWRQCVRTRLDATTGNVLFILDGLAPLSTDELEAAGRALVESVGAEASLASRLIAAAG
jgi:DNA/RNA-binding domain of Phe-tRNA-synthetase-like protein